MNKIFGITSIVIVAIFFSGCVSKEMSGGYNSNYGGGGSSSGSIVNCTRLGDYGSNKQIYTFKSRCPSGYTAVY